MNIAWLIFIALLIIALQSYVFSKLGLSRIQYSRYFNRETVFEGEEVEMIDEIANRKLLPIPWLRLESKIDVNLKFGQQQDDANEDNEAYHRTLFSLIPYQKITRHHKVTCIRRGFYRLNTVSLTTGDAFGLSQVNRTVNEGAQLLVYPKLLNMDDMPLPSHSFLGEVVAKRWIIDDPFLIAGIRDYTHGDPMNRINWKASARTNSLQVSQHEFTADHYLMIYLNFDQSEDSWMPILDKALIEKGISYAATMANEAINNGISTGFGCNSYLVDRFDQIDRLKETVRIEPENSKQQLNYLFETMAKLAVDRSKTFNQFLLEDLENQRENTDILLITSFMTDQIEEQFQRLREKGNAVEVLWLNAQSDEGREKEGESVAG